MRLYFGRDGHLRGYSMGLGGYIALIAAVVLVVLAAARAIILLLPLIALYVALAVVIKPSLARPAVDAVRRLVHRRT